MDWGDWKEADGYLTIVKKGPDEASRGKALITKIIGLGSRCEDLCIPTPAGGLAGVQGLDGG
jgi:hypothetical protein